MCGVREDTSSQIHGWWGAQGTEITSVDECRIKNNRPGLTYMSYKNPTDWSQPDFVIVLSIFLFNYLIILPLIVPLKK